VKKILFLITKVLTLVFYYANISTQAHIRTLICE